MKLKLLPDNENPDSVRKYRIGQAIVAYTAWLVALFLFAAAFVGWPKIGQLAWQDDVKTDIDLAVAPVRADIQEIKDQDIAELKQSSKEIKASLLAQSLIAARREQCEAIRTGSPVRFWNERLLDLKIQYKRVAGEQFDMPATCAEI